MLDKTYNARAMEERWYAAWERAGAFACGRRPEAPAFTIVIPPPNVTGNLHMGHALNNTLQDILVRRARMQGKDVLWQPGTDHAGIATQMVVERQLAEEGLTRHDLGREAFIRRVEAWKAQSGGAIIGQLRRLGASCDWSRQRFTMDDGPSAAVRKVFVDLYRAGAIYRAKRLVNWDPLLHTAISDLEVEQREVRGRLWTFRYPIEDEPGAFVAVATTRPETMLGDTAVAVHPEDERYRHLIGRRCRLPLADRLIPIIGDVHADPAKGTGAVKITPAHDFNDFEVGRRHGLPMINIFDSSARLKSSEFDDFTFRSRASKTFQTSAVLADEELVGPAAAELIPRHLRGLDRFEARDALVAELTALGLVERIEDHTLMMPYGDRSGVVIEPWLMDQWFVDAARLAEPAVRAVEEGRTRFVPEQWTKTYFEWMRNIQPWCISRQIWWGHQIPAWYDDDGNIFVELTEEEAASAAERHHGHPVPLKRDEDVLDTWFSSALWPFSTLGWPEDKPELARYYPTNVLVTAFDIIFFWVARMMMMGLEFMGEVPFRTVYIHALVRDEKGQKMSKSKGNVVDPLALIDRYGADALRFTLTALAVQGRDVKMSEARVEGYRNFATKLWNAARFCQLNGATPVIGFDPRQADLVVNRWLVGKVADAAGRANAALDAYRFNDYAAVLYHFTWGTFCDWYLEFAKPILMGGSASAQAETRAVAGWALDRILALLHPVMPFVTEELYQQMADRRGSLLIEAEWPAFDASFIDADADAELDWVIRLVSLIRGIRAEMNVPPGSRIPLLLKDADAVAAARLERYRDFIETLARLSSATLLDGAAPKGAIEDVLDQTTVLLPIADAIDIDAERSRLAREIGKLTGEIERVDKKLSNQGFLAKAPAEVVDAERDKRDDALAARGRLEDAAKRLAAL